MSQTIDFADVPFLGRVRSWGERVWDQIDRALLRLQGRVDTPAYDRWMPYGFAALHAAVLIVFVLARHHSLDLGTETAKYAQATWQIAEGFRPDTTLAGGNLIGEQGSLIIYPLAFLTSVLPRTETLLVIKALALAITIIPMWRIARRHGQLGIGVASTVVFVYTLYSAVHFMNAADFAPAVLAVPALMWAVLAGFDEREPVMLAAVVLVLFCRADLGLAVAGLGLLLLLEGRRRVGRIAALVGLGWFLVSIYGLQPALSDGGYPFLAPYAAFGDTPLRALWGIITHPVQFLQTVGTLQNFRVLVSLFAPVLFLPFTAPRYLLPAVPLYLLYMGADVPESRFSEAAQFVPITVFVFVATIVALQRAGRTLVKRVRVERRIVLALLLTALVFFISDSPTSPYREPWQWGQRDAADAARLEAVESLPDADVPVRASASVLPLLSERYGVYELDTFITSTDDDTPQVNAVRDAAVTNVDWLIIDRSNEADIEWNTFRVRMLEIGWQRTDLGEAIELWEFTGVTSAGSTP